MDAKVDRMRLNVGCGSRRLPGYIGVDVAPGPAVDVVAEAHTLPFDSGTIDEVLAVHLVEHVYEWEAPALFAEWFRVLRPRGRLAIELPDAMKAARNLVEGRVNPGKPPDQLHMWALYGDSTLKNPLMMHKAGWWFERLRPVVEAAGFREVRELETQFHPAGRKIRDFRLEALRP